MVSTYSPSSGPTPSGFRPVPRTGVIYVMTEAKRFGYRAGDAHWVNLGQGAPETGDIAGAPPRLKEIAVDPGSIEYSPIDGIPQLKEAVAELYNQRYRQGKKSKYTPENVAISSGGRLGLTRLVSTLGRTNVGHFLPDYTAYEELLDAFGTFVPIPLQLDSAMNYRLTSEQFKERVLGMGLSTVLLSNPSNPTGNLISGEELAQWLHVAREHSCSIIFDEFYSHYIYDPKTVSVSAAEFVEDVNRDPIVILDGFTKNWRYPGFRVSWTVAPRSIIEGIASAGSFLDGGCAHPLQLAAVPLVNKVIADQEAGAIKETFSAKRTFMIERLGSLGVQVSHPPQGGFYCWADLSNLPEEISTGSRFFHRGLEIGLITVPGIFFDINPGHRRPDRPSRFRNFSRFSFGPPMSEIRLGMEKLEELISKFR